jgi:hypothetical protein
MSTSVEHAATQAGDCVSDVMDYLFGQYPHAARRAGRHDHDGRLSAVVPQSRDDIAPLRAAVQRRLDALPPTGHAETRADLDTCRRVLDFELFRITALGQPYLGPMGYAQEADVSSYLASDYAPFDDRVAALHRHLAGLPEFLARATTVFRPTIPAGERLSGMAWASDLAANIRAAVFSVAGRRPDLAERLKPVAGAAADACEAYGRAVESIRPTGALLGPDRLAELLSVTEGFDIPIDDQLDEVEAEIAAIRMALSAAAARVGATSHREAFELMHTRVPAESVAVSLAAIIARLQEFWANARVLPTRTVNELRLCDASQVNGSDITFVISPPLEPVRQPHLLHVPEPPPPTDPTAPTGVWEYLNEPMLEMLAVHEAYAGHYLQVETALTVPSVIRNSLFWFTGFTEGWAHYVEELAIEHGLAAGRPLVEIAQLRFTLEAASRLRCFLALHSRRMTFAEACEHTAATCDWSLDRAARDVLETASDRDRAMYALGKLRIRRWRRELGTGVTREGLFAFHDSLMHGGTAPLSTVHRYVLDRRADDRENVR